MTTLKPNRDVERGLLAAILRRPEILNDVRVIVQKEDFEWVPYKVLWEIICDMADAKMSIDVVTVGDELNRRQVGNSPIIFACHDAPQFTGRAALAELRSQANPSAAITMAEAVADYGAKFRLIEAANKVVNWCVNGRRAMDITQDWNTLMTNMRIPGAPTAEDKHVQSLDHVLSLSYDSVVQASRGQVQFVRTGYLDIDRIVPVVAGGDVFVIAGRPGNGKSALLASIADNLLPEKKGVIFSLEMSNQQFLMRLLAMHSGVSVDKQRSGLLTSEDWEAYKNAAQKLKGYPLHMVDIPTLSPDGIKRVLSKLPHDFVMIDYVQLVSATGKHSNRVLELSEITRSIKHIAREFNVPIFVAAQLNRSSAIRQNNEPYLSDLRESGSIENDADVVLLLWRDDDKTDVTQFKIAKNRNGPTGRGKLVFIGPRTRFENYQS